MDSVRKGRLTRLSDELVYYETGPVDGPLLVCCHGAGYDHSTFDDLAASLAEAGWRVVAPDNRGAGKSTDNAGLIGSEGPAALVTDLLALLAELNAGPAVLLGHSLGGWSALGAAIAAPEAVSGLLLAATPAGIFTPEVEQFWEAFEARLREGAPPEVLNAIGLLRSRAPSLAEVATVGSNIPVVFVTGSEDPVYPPAVVRAAAAAVPGSTVLDAPGAAHLVHIEAPEVLLEAIGQFA